MADVEVVATTMAVRDDVVHFAFAMEAALKANDEDRGERGWIGSSCSVQWFALRMRDELKELLDAVDDVDPETVKKECADVANFAMMVYTILEERDRARMTRGDDG